MNRIILDFSGITSLWNLHEYLKQAFGLPDYYGHNMDALWDCLLYWFPEPTTIVLRNLSSLPREMHPEIPILLGVFSDLERKDENVTVKIEKTCSGEV